MGAVAFLGQGLFQPIAIGDGSQHIGFRQFAILFELNLQLLIDPRQLPGAFFDDGFQGLIAPLHFFEQAFLVFDTAVRADHSCHRAVAITC
ncbi:hypothetical protein D3C84_1058810 [compost metagenome]